MSNTMQKITATTIISNNFRRLDQLISENRIKPGSAQEEEFLIIANLTAIKKLLGSIGINNHHPFITIVKDPFDKDLISVQIDDKTLNLLKINNLYK
jgi:hypothetical protein